MSVVTESRFTKEANAIVDAETYPVLREELAKLRQMIEDERDKANRLTTDGGSEKDRREAKRRRMWATNSEKLIIELSDFHHGLGEFAPGGKYADIYQLAIREEVSA